VRITFLATYFPRPSNRLMGTWALAQATALARAGIDVSVVTLTPRLPAWAARLGAARSFAGVPDACQIGGVHVYYPRWLYYPARPLRPISYRYPRPFLQAGWISARQWLLDFVRRDRPDVLFAHHSFVSGYVARRIHDVTQIPYVVTDHDFDEIRDCLRFPGRRRLFTEVSNAASANVVVSSQMARDIQALSGHLQPVVVHNGVDAARRGAPAMRAPHARRVIFSAGFFYRRKAFPLLVRAFARIAGRYPDAILRIAGDGEDRAAVEAARASSGFADRIELLGALPHDQLLHELNSAYAFALFGWNEPFGVVYAEAMAAGLPILLSSDCGIMDVVREGVECLAVPPRDEEAAARALDRVLADPELAQRLAANARVAATTLTWSANATQMIHLFERARRSGART
jgi:glycosyltransferase involved in cell wall biosynthesis